MRLGSYPGLLRRRDKAWYLLFARVTDIAHSLFSSLLSIYFYFSKLSVYILVFTLKIHIYFRLFCILKLTRKSVVFP